MPSRVLPGMTFSRAIPDRRTTPVASRRWRRNPTAQLPRAANKPSQDCSAKARPLPADAGLYLMDTPCFSPESITSLVASGAQLVVFTTDQGNPYTSALAPTIKVTANPQAAKLAEQIDFDASEVFLGRLSMQDALGQLTTTMGEVIAGGLTWGEAVGGGGESISRLGPSI